MGDEVKAVLTVRYVDGSEEKFEFSRRADDLSSAGRIQEALSANQILLELEDRVLIIPFQNVRAVEISPAPSKLPGIALKNVRPIK